MPKGYQHLTRDQRCQISVLKSRVFPQKDIAEAINVSQTTISNELKRNSDDTGVYEYHYADVQARIRRGKASRHPRKMTPELVLRIEKHLKEGWSPEQISGRLKLMGINISHERIYQHVWSDRKTLSGMLFMYLRNKGKKYKKRKNTYGSKSKIPNRVDIKERPDVVNLKSRVGDWEGDTIVGKSHQSAILSYVDRFSKLTLLSRMTRKTAANVVSHTLKKFKDIPTVARKTITYDNGSEFSGHAEITEALNASCYFATPYHAWERGLNEHTNGLVRRYFPKSTDFNLITDEEVKEVENLLNNRPRKVLGYKTPIEAFAESTRKISLHS